MPTIAIVACTDRPGSNALKIANYLKPRYDQEGVDAEVISLRDFPAGDVLGGRYDDDIPSVDELNERVLSKDGILFILPEYNGSFPGIFKLFIDYLPFPKSFLGKPIAFLGEASGAFGGLRAVEQAQMICNYRNAYLFPERVFIERVNKQFSEDEGPLVPIQAKLLKSQTKNFAEFIKKSPFPKQNLDL